MALAVGILAASAAGAQADPFCISGGRAGTLVEHVRRTADPVEAATALRRLTTARRSCTSCHVEAGVWFLKPNTPSRWPLNAYGHALTILAPGLAPFGIGNAGAFARVDRVPVDPTVADGPTFGDRIHRGLPPQPLFPAEEYEAAAAADLRIARPPATLDFKEALTLALTTSGPVLQASELAAIDAGTAGALARFAGHVLMLGLRALPEDVASRLAASQADTVWLHSLPSIEPEAAAALVPLRGDLVITGLERLDAEELAAKLAARPGRLALPFLRSLAPAAARALVARTGATCLESLAEVPTEPQAALSSAQGMIDLPALRRLDSPALARKLAASPNVQLGGLESLSVEIARILVEPAPFREGLVLSLAALTPEVLAVLADSPKAVGRLTVLGREVSPEQVRAIGGLPLRGTVFAEIADPSAELAAAAAEVDVVFPNLRRLDSARLAAAIVQRADSFRFFCLESVREISPTAAVEVAKHDPRELLRLSSLASLSAEQAEVLLATPRSAILLPALEEISTESLARLLLEPTRTVSRAPRSTGLSLGVSRLPPGPFAPAASRQEGVRFDLSLTALATLSADDARNLVACLRPASDSLAISVAELPPEAAAVLAQWPGRLSISGLRTLTPAVAAALAQCSAKTLLGLNSLTTLDAQTAEKLAGGPVNYSLNGLTSLTPDVAAALARKRNWALRLPALETIDVQVAAELVKGTLVGLPGLSSLDPEVAELLVSCSTWEPQLPALTSLTPETAAVLAKVAAPKELSLTGLTSLDPETARALAACPQWRPLLPALRSIELETVAGLAACQGPLSLAGLRRVTPELAAALAGSPAWDGRLPGITSLETADAVAIAKALARREGRLELRNLRRISPRTLAALRRKPDLVIPPVESLTLIPEPAAGTADDFSSPED